MNPGFWLGPVRVNYYGLILAAAILVGYYWARYRSRLYSLPLWFLDRLLLITVPLAVVGARLYFVVFNWELYRDQPQLIFAIWQGGLAFHGALLGGLLGLVFVFWSARRSKTKVRWSAVLDLLAPVLLLSQAIGRVANFVNQEAFGSPTQLPWGIFIDAEHRPTEFAQSEYFHPTFAYEALWNLAGVVVLLSIERRWQKTKILARGRLFALYLIWYSIGRLCIEFLRTDALYLGSVRVAQLVSILLLVGSTAYLWYRHRR
jgi:phosphatidylglycerol:prolipoprotein diacylglycerol transferase